MQQRYRPASAVHSCQACSGDIFRYSSQIRSQDISAGTDLGNEGLFAAPFKGIPGSQVIAARAYLVNQIFRQGFFRNIDSSLLHL